MFGPPEDVEGECNARLFVGDDFGDNHCTFRCPLEAGHWGVHQERYDTGRAGKVVVTWEKDEREKCDHCDQWTHAHDYDNCPRHADDHDYKTCAICQSTDGAS